MRICSGAACHGAQQPFAPGPRLFLEAGVEEREQRQRRVAQPAMAVVPVAHAADAFRQRGRGRGDDAAGRRVRQRLERDERAAHRILHPIAHRAALDPLAPEAFRSEQRLLRVDRGRRLEVRRPVREDEREPRRPPPPRSSRRWRAPGSPAAPASLDAPCRAPRSLAAPGRRRNTGSTGPRRHSRNAARPPCASARARAVRSPCGPGPNRCCLSA